MCDVQPTTACCQMKFLLQAFLTILKGQNVRLTLSHGNNPRDLTLCSNYRILTARVNTCLSWLKQTIIYIYICVCVWVVCVCVCAVSE